MCPALSLQGLTLFDSCMELYIELAATIDGLGPFVRACHVLEGDGFLAPLVYDKLLELREHTEVAGFPNVKALSRSRHPHDAGAQHTLVSHGKSCVQPCFRYFNDLFPESERPAAFATFTFLSDAERESLEAETPKYRALSRDLAGDIDIADWWRRMSRELPNFASLAFNLMLTQPSSACVERCFSLLRTMLSDKQESMLEDGVEVSVMLRFNENSRNTLPEDVRQRLPLAF